MGKLCLIKELERKHQEWPVGPREEGIKVPLIVIDHPGDFTKATYEGVQYERLVGSPNKQGFDLIAYTAIKLGREVLGLTVGDGPGDHFVFVKSLS